jgi:hypothetical protein
MSKTAASPPEIPSGRPSLARVSQVISILGAFIIWLSWIDVVPSPALWIGLAIVLLGWLLLVVAWRLSKHSRG